MLSEYETLMNEHQNTTFLSLSFSLSSHKVNPRKKWANPWACFRVRVTYTCTPVNALCMHVYTHFQQKESQFYLYSSEAGDIVIVVIGGVYICKQSVIQLNLHWMFVLCSRNTPEIDFIIGKDCQHGLISFQPSASGSLSAHVINSKPNTCNVTTCLRSCNTVSSSIFALTQDPFHCCHVFPRPTIAMRDFTDMKNETLYKTSSFGNLNYTFCFCINELLLNCVEQCVSFNNNARL
jgi:hypothetical protein